MKKFGFKNVFDRNELAKKAKQWNLQATMNVRWLIQINEVVSEVSSLVGNSVLEIHLINSVIYMNPFFGKIINLKFYKHDFF